MNIEIKELSMRYKTRENLHIDHFVFQAGKAYGIVGQNGAGKTTLFKCMTNLVPGYSGTITINDQDVRKNSEVLLHVGIVLDKMAIYQQKSGWFNIEYFAGLRGEFDRTYAEQLAQDLQIADALPEKVTSYSYGMQKKLVLLIALMHQPAILILDEPFRGLDKETVSWFKKILKDFVKTGNTLLISSHVEAELTSLCEEVLVLEKGFPVELIQLAAAEQSTLRKCSTSDNLRFIELLEALAVPYQANEDETVTIDLANPNWTTIKEQLVTEQIEIEELSKISALAGKVN